jgi:integrase
MSMCGARPFENREEIARMMQGFQGAFAFRNRAIMSLGIRSGLRISEILSLRIRDVLGAGNSFRDAIYVRRSAMKGKLAGRRLPLHPVAKITLGRWLVERRQREGDLDLESYIFASRKGVGRPISRSTACHVFAEAARCAGLREGISTHSMRKWVAMRVYRASGNCLVKTGAVLGHRQIGTTARYCTSAAAEPINS